MEQVEYVTKTEIVNATKITQDIIDGYEIGDGSELCLGDYLIFKDGSVSLYDGKEFERKYRINSKENWEDDIESSHGFEWALMQMKNGWKVRRDSWPDSVYIYFNHESCEIIKVRGSDSAVFFVSHKALMLSDGWEILNED